MSRHINDLGQLVVDDRDRQRGIPTLRNIYEGQLLLHLNPPETPWTNDAKALYMLLALFAGDDVGERRRRLLAARESVTYDPTLMQTIRYFVCARFGDWNPFTLTRVHDWLLAEHGFAADSAWEVLAPELLTLLRQRREPKGARATAPDSGNSEPPAPPQGDAVHSDDFRTVRWLGTTYAFTPMQAACIRALWEAWEAGTPDLGVVSILEAAGSAGSRLDDIFKNGKLQKHPAWGTMIRQGSTKGTYRLAAPSI